MCLYEINRWVLGALDMDMDMDATPRGAAWELGMTSTPKEGSRAVRARTCVAEDGKTSRYTMILEMIWVNAEDEAL